MIKNVVLLVFTIAIGAKAISQPLAYNNNFGENGHVITNFKNDLPTYLFSAAAQPDGKIIIGGYPITRVLADGTPDSSFNGNGTFSLPGYQDAPESVVLQQDGRIVAMYYGSGYDIVFLRLNANGTVDSSYGTDGIVTISMDGEEISGTGCVIQPDDKIVFTGQRGSYNDNHLIVGRLLPSGSLDNSFNGSGIATVEDNPGTQWYAGAVALQSTGKIIFAGSYTEEGGAPVIKIFGYNANGSRDNTFNGSGSFEYAVPGSGGESISGICIQPDNKILLTGASNGALLVIKLTTSGQADSSFNTTGIYTDDSYSVGNNIFLRPGGKILIAGNTVTFTETGGEWDYGITQLNEDGSIDITFAEGGTKVLSVSGLDNEEAAILQANGSLIVLGFANELPLITMIKVNDSGNTDSSFGNNGVKMLHLLGTDESVGALLVQPDRKIIAIGNKTPGVVDSSGIAFVRYQPNGTTDSSFGLNGKGGYPDYNITFRSAALQSTGKIIISGTSYDFETGGINNIVFRLNGNGSVDSSFGTSYRYISPALNGAYLPSNICVLNDNRIITAQNLPDDQGGYIAITRLTANGVPDNSFGSNGTTILYIDTAHYYANNMVLQADGKMLISAEQNIGDSITRYILIRLLANGTLDNSFDADGIKALPVNGYLGEGSLPVKVQPNGKIVVVATGMNEENTTASVFRFNSNGTPDVSFNGTGRLLLQSSNPGLPGIFLNDFALHPDSSIYITGAAYNTDSTVSFLMKIKNNGTTDTSVNSESNGIITLPGKWKANDIIILPDSSILLGGSAFSNTSNNDFLLVNYKKSSGIYRFTGNGSWTVATNWQDNKMPPAILPQGDFIYIEPAAGGKCILNIQQRIAPGGNLIVANGRSLVIAGGLFITQ